MKIAETLIVDSKKYRKALTADLVPAPEKASDEKTMRAEKVKKGWVVEVAKSGRSTCRGCGELIERGSYRLGVVTFYPHRNCRWYCWGECMQRALLGASTHRVWGLKKLGAGVALELDVYIRSTNATITKSLPGLVGELDMPRFASALTSRYRRFRSFRFGLPEEEMYGRNWNWRCFLATMLVCNTHETAMLAVTDKLFLVYPDPESFLKLEDDMETQRAWIGWMKKHDLRHAARKMANTVTATRKIVKEFGGHIPASRGALQKMAGVGRHVASVTMAWVHESPEFGIDTHVSRILKRWGYVPEGMGDVETEDLVKRTIPSEQIGHFSRAFVDHGQQVCGFTPDCESCFLKGCCPTAAKELEW